MKNKRVFLIVLDSFGIGAEPDADVFGDAGTNTIRSCARSKYFDLPNLARLGLFNIDTVAEAAADGMSDRTSCEGDVMCYDAAEIAGGDAFSKSELDKDVKAGVYARLRERSMGKDTTIGHWEIAGVYSPDPLPTYPNGFPAEVLDEFSKRTGRGVLCNLPYSGTAVIEKYGREHIETGALIVYTSADSVFQIAAHEDIVPVEQLYEYCRIAREILVGKHGVGRVIARPFIGEEGSFTRTSRRHDFSLEAPGITVLDQLHEAGFDTLSIGKIKDIFVGRGISEFVYTSGNTDGLEKTLKWADRDFNGLCFVNLVDYDMLYGHRRDIDGYAKALKEFDKWLPSFLDKLGSEDLVIITADHGCDPGFTKTTDHTREYAPCVIWGPSVSGKNMNLGTRSSYADIGATIVRYFGIDQKITGEAMNIV